MSNDKYIGLDVSQSRTVAAVHNHLDKCVMESIIAILNALLWLQLNT